MFSWLKRHPPLPPFSQANPGQGSSIFTDHLHGDRFYGIRLFAARNSEGGAEADCRINGVDWAPGAAALLEYVATWPDRGFEYRKQLGCDPDSAAVRIGSRPSRR